MNKGPSTRNPSSHRCWRAHMFDDFSGQLRKAQKTLHTQQKKQSSTSFSPDMHRTRKNSQNTAFNNAIVGVNRGSSFFFQIFQEKPVSAARCKKQMVPQAAERCGVLRFSRPTATSSMKSHLRNKKDAAQGAKSHTEWVPLADHEVGSIRVNWSGLTRTCEKVF